MNASFAESLDTESANLMQLRDTEDHKEAARAFAEKRAPKFRRPIEYAGALPPPLGRRLNGWSTP